MVAQAERLGPAHADPVRRDPAHRSDRHAGHHRATAHAGAAVRPDAAARGERWRGCDVAAPGAPGARGRPEWGRCTGGAAVAARVRRRRARAFRAGCCAHPPAGPVRAPTSAVDPVHRRWPRPRPSVTADVVVGGVPAESGTPTTRRGTPQRPAPQQTPAQQPVAQQSSGGSVDAADVRRVWPTILQAVQRRRRAAQVLLENATVSRLDGSTLVLSMPTAGLARKVAEPANSDLLREALHEVLGVSWSVRCEAAGGDVPPAGGRSGSAPTRPAKGPRSSARPAEPPPPEPPTDERVPGRHPRRLRVRRPGGGRPAARSRRGGDRVADRPAGSQAARTGALSR